MPNGIILFFSPSFRKNIDMEIRHHALLYALIVRSVSEASDKEEAEETIRQITVRYGRKRGRRMADHSSDKDLNGFFICGEWKGKQGENISSLTFGEDSVTSIVSKCAWYDTWKEYGMERYGSYYCRYIDQAICEGYDGGFSLKLDSAIGLGDRGCIFRWSSHADRKLIEDAEKRYILPFDFHCRELYECAYEVLKEKGKEDLSERIRNEFCDLFPDQKIFE